MSTPIAALERMYDSATLGISVHPSQTPRICYSLPLLVRKEMARSRINEETAQQVVWGLVSKLIKEHGDLAPLFIDDGVSREPTKPAIVLDTIL
jgi:hypothetical protein